jgi:hypothetical protein
VRRASRELHHEESAAAARAAALQAPSNTSSITHLSVFLRSDPHREHATAMPATRTQLRTHIKRIVHAAPDLSCVALRLARACAH